jgi:hypothetical protein
MTMFELENKDESKSRQRTLIYGVVFFFLLAATATGLYVAFRSYKTASPVDRGLPGAQRVGKPDFDTYAKDVAITNQEAYYATNALGGQQIVAQGRVQNLGNRTITGLEVRAVAYDFDGKPLVQRLAAPIPRSFSAPLRPNESLPITVRIDSAPDEGLVQSIKIELHGLILQ